MNERLREPAFAGALALMFLIGVLFDLFGDAVEPAPPSRSVRGELPARATFCPASSGGGATTRAAVIATDPTPAPAKVTSGSGTEALDLAPDRALGFEAKQDKGLELAGYGAPISAGAMISTKGPVQGSGALLCSANASSRWFFAAGSASLGSDERIILYNPFPDEAVVRLTFFTTEGIEERATFEEIPVPARSLVAAHINEGIRTQLKVAVSAIASRGRVIAWRELYADPEQLPSGLQASAGAVATSLEWYFPEGAIGPGVEEQIALLNPSGREAEVSIRLSGMEKTIPARRLMEIPVPRRSLVSVSLEEELQAPKDLTGVSATVTSINGVGIVAERTVWYSTNEITGVASETGVRRPSTAWALPPAAIQPTTDSVTLMNPGAEPVTASIVFLRRDDEPITPADLDGIRLRAGSRIKIPVGEFTDGRSVPAIVTASGPIVVERFSYSSAVDDVASVMGIPIRQLP
jgi:hypothetical protein